MKHFRCERLLLAFLLFTLLVGCRNAPLDIAVRYESLGDLRPDGAVYVGQTRIGRIEKISSTERGDYLVKIAIDPDHKSEATEYTRFLLSSDPLDRDNAAIVLHQSRPGGELLESGSIVKGEQQGLLNQFLSRLQQEGQEASRELKQNIDKMKQSFAKGTEEFSARLEGALDDISKSLTELEASWRSATAPDELEKMQQDLDRFIEEFKKSGAELQEKMRRDIIPQIRQQLQELEQKMRQENHDQNADQLERRLDEISSI